MKEMELKERHRFADFLYWGLGLLLPVVVACLAIEAVSVFWTAVYLVFCLFVFAVVLYRFFCSHCPHYLQAEGRVKCMFIWGAPKCFRARPGPYTFVDKVVFLLGLLAWILFPAYWLLAQPGLVLVYVLCLLWLAATLYRYECGRCIHFHCPANRVPEPRRREYQESKETGAAPDEASMPAPEPGRGRQ